MNFEQVARYTIGLVWIYQGLFPKLIQIAPLEMQMSGSVGLSDETTFWFIKIAGVAEIMFGLLFIRFYNVTLIQAGNILALIGLLIFTAIQTPALLIEAFNPVTTNIPLIMLSIYLYRRINDVTRD